MWQDLADGSVVGAVVRIMYSVGLLLSSPLQLFPAVKVSQSVDVVTIKANALFRTILIDAISFVVKFVYSYTIVVVFLTHRVCSPRYHSSTRLWLIVLIFRTLSFSSLYI